MATPQLVIPLPAFAVPPYLDKPPTGQVELDLVPIVTMAACFPTLWLFASKKRWCDFALYGLGFLVAVVYHIMHFYAHEGLASNVFLGINGAGWRTIDILSANVLLARTMGHALNVDHPIIALLPNVALPGVLVLLLASFPSVGLALASRVTVGIIGLTLALHLVVGGRDMMRNMGAKYSHPRMARAFVSMAIGIFSFVLPTIQPDRYWLYHSLWHCFMGLGYYELYVYLIASEEQQKAGSKGKRQTKAAISMVASSEYKDDSDESSTNGGQAYQLRPRRAKRV